VLGLAARTLDHDEPAGSEVAEAQLTLLGLVGLADPPRAGARQSVAACRSAGISVAMVTGDHPATAAAVAREVGLSLPGAPIVLGVDLPEDEAALGELVDQDGIVLARVTPEDKLRIARALRDRGHVVAMTGDGVNDGPALHEADIGVAMGRSGTDVAREAADLVLLDDDFRTIVAAAEDGRNVYANARRLLTYHITDNVAEVTPFLVWGFTGGQFPLVLGVMQILALDIGTDTFSAVALGAEPPHAHAASQTPARGSLFDRLVARRAFLVLGPVEALMALGAAVVTFLAAGWRPGQPFPEVVVPSAAGAAFATVVIAQTACAWACRSSTVTPGALGWGSNRLLVAGSSLELVIAAACLFIPPIALALRHSPPPPAAWAVALLAAVLVLAADWLDKRWRARPSEADRDQAPT
jgi:magnesium-transporting ATPase (P-type)